MVSAPTPATDAINVSIPVIVHNVQAVAAIPCVFVVEGLVETDPSAVACQLTKVLSIGLSD